MKAFVCAFCFALFSLSVLAQSGVSIPVPAQVTPAQAAALDELQKLNGELVELYRKEKFNEAFRIAGRMQALIDTNQLGEDATALTILGNIGEIYLAKGKETEAIALFQRILPVYRSKFGPNSTEEGETTDRITRAYFNKEDFRNAEVYALKLLPIWEHLYGSESAKVAGLYTYLGNIYRRERKWELADQTLLRGIALNDRVLTQDEKRIRADLDNYTCFLYHWGYQLDRFNEYYKKVNQFNDARRQNESDPPTPVMDAVVLNGKALKLPPPVYPRQAIRTRGFVAVQVTIDETGGVVATKATCGIKGFLQASRDAAMRARFSPTLVNGVPVQVTGIVIYHFWTW